MADAPLPTIRLHTASTGERRAFPIRSRQDPTGGAVEFGLTPIARNVDTAAPSSWAAGTWVTTWDSARRVAWAETPNMGAGLDLSVTAEEDYILWGRLNFGGTYAPARRIALVEVR